MILIKKIALKNLREFVNSKEYLGYKNKPISKQRVNSFITNPYGNDEDIVLYLALKDKRLIGYRTIFVDRLYFEEQHEKIGWISGTWTHENYRKKGVSTLLFNEVYADWEGRIITSNFTERSKYIYEKSRKFEVLRSFQGFRYYLRFSLYNLLPQKSRFFSNIKSLLWLIDKLVNSILDWRFKLSFNLSSENYKSEKLDDWNNEINDFLKPFKEKELFRRDESIFRWILEYPWIQNDKLTKTASKEYYFSSYAKVFESNFYIISSKKTNSIVGVILIKIINNQIKIPYVYNLKESNEAIKALILKLCIENKINYITLYDKSLVTLFSEKKWYFLYRKKFSKNYFIGKTLIDKYPTIKKYTIQHGDGDCVFT